MKLPSLTILIMAVGTRGDIEPFCLLGMRLKDEGHRVRIATHECFRLYITNHNLEFFPLAGDPIQLSQFMVNTKGCIVPTSIMQLREVLPPTTY